MARELHFVRLRNLERPPRPRYLVEGLIPATDITVVWGDPKSGKTFQVLDLALHVAAGKPYRGRHVEPGAVAYCALEGGDAFPDRLQALRLGLGIEDDIPFYLCRERFTFQKARGSRGSEFLIRAIQADIPERPALVVIDTLNRSLEGSENSDEDMTHYTRCLEDIAQSFGCAVIVIHHCGVSKDKPRGHTSLTGTCVAQLRVARVNRAPFAKGGPIMVSLAVQFMKDGPDGETIFSWLQPTPIGIDDAGTEIVSCCVVEAPEPYARAFGHGVSGLTAKALALLQELVRESKDGKVSVQSWRERCVIAKIGKTKESSRTSFYKALDKLEAEGIISLHGQWVNLEAKQENGKDEEGG
jgi:hypothetical protein